MKNSSEGRPIQAIRQSVWQTFFMSNLARYVLLSLVFLIFCVVGKAHAQVPTVITGDGTLGTNVPAECNVCNITGGTRPGNGSNLFHSFGQFDVGATGVANFLNDSALPTTNILSRVTGGNPSTILGTIQTDGFGNANLFLMNPAGIVFGPNASLNVGGSTHFTTADYLRLADGMQFTAIPSAQDALLSIAPVDAFGFLGPNPGAISVDGSKLSVGEEQNLSFVGGNITIGGGLNALGGQVALASVASPGEVLSGTYVSAPNVNGQSFTTMGNMVLSEGARLDVSGDAAGGDAAGTVIIRGGQLMMTNATISADTGNNDGAETGVSIQLSGDLTIETNLEVPTITARSLGDGNAGEIQIESENMTIMATSPDPLNVIATVASGMGKAGDVSLTAHGVLEFLGDPDGFTFFIHSGTASEGAGGNINIKADSFIMEDAFINTGDSFDFEPFDPFGPSGNVLISAVNMESTFSGIQTESFSSTAGSVTIEGGDVLLDNTPIGTTGLEGSGGIRFDVDTLTVINSLLDSRFFSESLQPIPSPGITVNARIVELMEGSQLVTSTAGNSDAGHIQVTATDYLGILGNEFGFRPSGIFSNSFGFNGPLGKAGTISITTSNLEMTDGGVINTATQSSGLGGNVIINAQNVSITGQQDIAPIEPIFGLGNQLASGIFTSTVGDGTLCSGLCGDSGNISITTGSLNLAEGGSINSGTSGGGKGGTISVNATENISIAGTLNDGTTPGGVFSQTIGTDPNSGAGGAIALMAGQNFTLSDGATVSVSSDGPGNAGAIGITAGSFTIAQGGVVDSGTTSTGQGGSINVNASGNISISGTLANAPSGVLSQATGTDPGSGTGGAISLTAGQNFTLRDGATVSASSSGPANAGNITLTANDTILIDTATVTTDAAEASGGNIKLNANDTIQLVDSTIASSVEGDVNTQGGDISLDPDFIILQNSRILAKAVAGQGGNISLIANDAVLVDPFSVLDASSALGISGSVNIQAPIQNLSGTIAPLPQDPVPVSALYGARCVAGAGGHFSTFVDSKTDSLAPHPGTFLASPFLPLSNSSTEKVSENGSMSAEVSGTNHAPSPQVGAYTLPVLFAHNDGVLSSCP